MKKHIGVPAWNYPWIKALSVSKETGTGGKWWFNRRENTLSANPIKQMKEWGIVN
jgi:hypothetical protein